MLGSQFNGVRNGYVTRWTVMEGEWLCYGGG